MIRAIDMLRYAIIVATVTVWCFGFHCQSKTRTHDVMERFGRDKGRLAATFTALPPKKYLEGEQLRYYDLCVKSMYAFFALAILSVLARKL
jgi:hypothetical protein